MDSYRFRIVDRRARTALLLERIATTLGKPTSTFLSAPASVTKRDDTREMLDLWLRLKDPADRQTLLSSARALVAEQA